MHEELRFRQFSNLDQLAMATGDGSPVAVDWETIEVVFSVAPNEDGQRHVNILEWAKEKQLTVTFGPREQADIRPAYAVFRRVQ